MNFKLHGLSRHILAVLILCIHQGLTLDQRRPRSSLRFLVVGDWGGLPRWPFYSQVQTQVANQMGRFAKDYSIEFVVSTGDNFYEDGVVDVDDIRFKHTFEDVYSARSLQVPWYPVLGNHDYHRNASAQISYSQKSDRWNLVDYNYTLHFTIPATNVTVTMVMIDTVILCGVSNGEQPLPGPEDPVRASQMYDWIEKQLQEAQSSDYILVVGHYPLFSVGIHGYVGCMQDGNLLPLMYEYRVSAYFCGHDHNLQHMSSMSGNWTIENFLVGAGARIEPRTNHQNFVPTIATRFFSPDKDGGFALVEMDTTTARLTLINGKGETVHSGTFKSRRGQDDVITDGEVVKQMSDVEKEREYIYKKNNENKQYAGMYRIP